MSKIMTNVKNGSRKVGNTVIKTAKVLGTLVVYAVTVDVIATGVIGVYNQMDDQFMPINRKTEMKKATHHVRKAVTGRK